MPEVKEQTRKMPPMSARAMFQPETFDAANNTIEVVFATETPVFRNVWGEKYFEVLVCDSSSVRLTRMNQGGPVVDTHSTWSLSDQFGVVERAWIDGNQCRALIRLSTTDGDKEIVEKIKTGILRNVSVQYRIYAYEMDDAADNQTPTMRVTDWEPLEISFVPVPADMNSGARSNQNEPNEVIVTRKISNTNTMSKPKEGVGAEHTEARTETPPAPVAAPAPAAPAEGGDDQSRAATAAERTRVKDITAAVRSVKLPDTFLDKLIEDGTSVDNARRLIIDELAKGETAQPAVQAGIRVIGDEGEKRRNAIIDALALRSGVLLEKDLKPEALAYAREFRPMSLFDIAKDSLSRGGVDFRGWDKMETIGRSFTSSSSDFPILLEGTNRRVLLAAYNIVADTWRRFCAIGSVSDFREHKRLRMGSFDRLDAVQENGEFKTKKITDAEAEKVSAGTFGNIINVTRVMIINDDLAGFTRLASMLGRAAARSIEIDVYALLASNPTMSDGTALFHADHGNLINPGSAMSVNSFDELRVKMASQKDKDGNDYLDMRPSILLCGISKGGEAKVINDAQYDPDTANKLQRPNKVRGLFGDIVDTPRITGNEYYAFADPNQEPVLEVSFLDGNQTPFMESQEGFTVDGIKWKVRHDYGVGAVGWRGAVKNPGA